MEHIRDGRCVDDGPDALRAWAIKWNPSQCTRIPPTFTKAYPESETATIHRENIDTFLLEA